MLSDREKQRYHRHLILKDFGEEAQEKLKAARVLVIGAGGLGCPVLQYLTAAGVGTIGIIDDDRVDETNLHRQVLYSVEDVGRHKAEVAGEKLRAQNALVKIDLYIKRLVKSNALEIIKGYDLVLDGSDNFATRYLVNDACVILDKPFVSGAIYRFEGQVSVFNYRSGPTYRCLFPEPPEAGDVPSCSEAGVLGVLPGVTGCYQATEAIKVITGKGKPLSGRLLVMNLLNNDISTLTFEADPENKNITGLGEYAHICALPEVPEIDKERVMTWQKNAKKFRLIDIRQEWEFEEYNIGGQNIPFHQLPAKLRHTGTGQPVVFICNRGNDSALAVKLYKEFYPEGEAFSLNGGIESLKGEEKLKE